MGFFDDLDGNIETPKKKGFFADLHEEPSRARSLASAFPKGLIKGGKNLGSLHDPIGSFFGSQTPLEQQAVEQLLPTQEGHFAERALETAGEYAPNFALGPGGLVAKGIQSGTGALGKELLNEIGAPEWLQEVGGAVASLSPQAVKGTLSKKLMPSSSQKELYNLMKNEGLTDKQITPFLQSEKKAKYLSKLARPFLSPEKFKKETEPVADLLYRSLEEKQSSLPPLSGLRKTAFLSQLDKKLENIHPRYKKLIREDLSRLKNSEMTFKDLRDFEEGINIAIGDTQGKKAVLGILKEPIKFAENLLSPSLFKEKELINKAYSSRMNILNKLPENLSGNVKEKAFGMLGSLAPYAIAFMKGGVPGIASIAGVQLAAAKFLTSPRFQNMQQKLFRSIMDGNQGASLKILNEMINSTEKFTSEEED